MATIPGLIRPTRVVAFMDRSSGVEARIHFKATENGDVMSIDSVAEMLIHRLDPMGVSVGILSDAVIVLSARALKGLIILSPDGGFSVKVGTEWGDVDRDVVQGVDQLPDKMADLFANFWARRGLDKHARNREGETL